MQKFKVGDKIKVVKEVGSYSGLVGTICEYNKSHDCYFIKPKNGGDEFMFYSDELKLLKRKKVYWEDLLEKKGEKK